jgi:hypothetical protein
LITVPAPDAVPTWRDDGAVHSWRQKRGRVAFLAYLLTRPGRSAPEREIIAALFDDANPLGGHAYI